MPEKSEVRKRLEDSVMPVCPECGSENVWHYLTSQQTVEEHYQCRNCKALFYTEKI